MAYHPNIEEYHNSLRAYGVSEDDQKEYRLFLDTYNLEDVQEMIEDVADVSPIEDSNGTYYKLNNEKNGIEIYFTDKPDEETRNMLKANKFRWSNFNKCWYAKQSESTLAIGKELSNGKVDMSHTSLEVAVYPEINIDDIETYTIDEKLQKAEHDSAWVFRKGERDHNSEIQRLLKYHTEKVIEVVEKMDNEYYIFKIKEGLQRFKKNYHAAYVKYLSHKANNPSWAVTGRGGMNVNKYNKTMDRQNALMMDLANMPKEFEELVEKYEYRAIKEKKKAIENEVANTEIDITFKTVTKEFEYLRRQEKKRVYVHEDYWICKLWGSFSIFKGNEEIHSMKTTQKLDDAKKYVTMLVNEEMKTAV